jgi:hypothetical protein
MWSPLITLLIVVITPLIMLSLVDDFAKAGITVLQRIERLVVTMWIWQTCLFIVILVTDVPTGPICGAGLMISMGYQLHIYEARDFHRVPIAERAAYRERKEKEREEARKNQLM